MKLRRLANSLARSLRPVAVAATLCAAAAPALPAAAQSFAKQNPDEIKDLELTNKLGERIPLHLEFTDSSSGRPVALRDIFQGKPSAGGDAAPTPSLADTPPDGLPRGQRPVLLLMMYFRCPILCPKMHQEVTELLGNLEFRIGRDFDVLMVSFDPLDTAREAEKFKVDGLMLYAKPVDEYVRSGWHYLTGTAENSRTLADAIGFSYRYIPESEQYSHGPAIFLLTPEGVVSRVFPNFEFTEPERLGDVRMALVEASQGRIGSTFDRLMLFCYRFDPREGSYVLQALRVMQIGGLITVLCLGGLVGWLIRGELRKRTRTAVGLKAPVGGTSELGSSTIKNAAVGAP